MLFLLWVTCLLTQHVNEQKLNYYYYYYYYYHHHLLYAGYLHSYS